YAPLRAVVPPKVHRATHAADRFFPRRMRVINRACGSPKIPCTRDNVLKPANLYASDRRRCLRVLGIESSCQNFPPLNYHQTLHLQGSRTIHPCNFTHSNPRRPKNESMHPDSERKRERASVSFSIYSCGLSSCSTGLRRARP